MPIKYTIVERELLKRLDTLNFRINKQDAELESLKHRLEVIESMPLDSDNYTIKQAAIMSSRTERTIQRWIKDGKIKYFKIRNRCYLPKNDFQEFMDTRLRH